MTSALLLLACAPRYGGLPPITPDQLYSPLPVQHVLVEGVDLAYVDSGGAGRPVVFVHGLSSNLAFWEYQLGAFAATHRVLAVDLPGFGASGRPDAPYTPPWYAEVLEGWMDAVGLESAVFVGHSMGGQIAITLALDAPERVQALVLSAPAGLERFEPGHTAWMKEYWHEARALEASEQDIRTNIRYAAFNRYDEGVERFIQERVRIASTPEFAATSVAISRCVAGMLDHPVADRLGEVQQPTLIVFGTRDRMIPNPVFNGGRTRAVAESGRDAMKDAELVMIAGAGHTVHHDAPEPFNQALARFLEP